MFHSPVNSIEFLLTCLFGYLTVSHALVTLSSYVQLPDILFYLSLSGKFVLLSFIQFSIAVYHVFAFVLRYSQMN